MRLSLGPLSRVALPAVLWLWLVSHLKDEWSLNAQYNYGWAVPFLAALLFYLRWQTRPAPHNVGRSAQFAAWAALFALLPIRFIEEANPDWRLLGWALALLVVGFSLLQLLRAGGWPWIKHFAFPVCFILVAVPWPVRFENAVVHALTHAVAYIAVETAGWLGIAAYQVGNIIQLANGFVGVDEACSGVKTLQASIMVSLFLGELLMLTARRRIALLVAGGAWVLACNVVRATTLMIIAARSGFPALEHWHDLVGTAVLVLGMAGLAGGAILLRSRGETTPSRPPITSSLQLPLWAESGAGLLCLALIFASSEAWYRVHENRLIERPRWEARWPEENGATAAPIAEATAEILRYSRASSAVWTGPAATRWWGFFARWEPRRAAQQLVRSHSPEICLPAVGRTFRGERAPIEVALGELRLVFRVYEFVQEDRPLFVFVCIQEDKTAARDRAIPLQWSTSGRLRAVLNGERNLGQRLLELAALGFPDYAAAQNGFGETLSRVLQTDWPND